MPFNHQLPAFDINLWQKLWLSEVYKRNREGNRFFAEHIRVYLDDQLPRDFQYESIDTRLLEHSGTRITILGILALGENAAFTDDINKVALSIRQLIKENVDRQDITIDQLVDKTGFAATDISFYLDLLFLTGTFYSGASMEQESTRYKSIRVSGNKAVFDNYMSFPGVETLIYNRLQSHGPQPGPGFSPDDIYTANQKLDMIIELLEQNFTGNILQWTDVKNEINEMRNHYSLPKKNWLQLLWGKFREMVVSGVISETISKEIVREVKNLFQKLLT